MEKIIEVKNLSKQFKNFKAVKNISFDVKKGEIFGFLGPNGAGKSTTIRVLTTLLRPTSGTVKVGGFSVDKEADKVREKIGLVAEKIILYDLLTARENLHFFGRLYRLQADELNKRIDFWLKELGMKRWENKLVGSFSTGMKQRVNLARALLTEPDVLFLDEPTLGLDPQTTRHIRDFILALNKEGKTIVLTTHDMHEAELVCDRIAIINKGELVAVDTLEGLKKRVPKIKNPSLEEIFLNLTGKEVNDLPRAKVVGSSPHFRGVVRKQNRIR